MQWLASLVSAVVTLFSGIFGVPQVQTIVQVTPMPESTQIRGQVINTPTTTQAMATSTANATNAVNAIIGLTPCYTITSGGVFWPFPASGGTPGPNNTTRLDADPTTFVALTKALSPFPYSCFGKDTNAVFFDATQIEGADPNTFQILTLHAGSTLDLAISKDSHSVYFDENPVSNTAGGKYITSTNIILLNNNYIKTPQGIYFIGDVGNFSIDPVQGADIDTFYVLSDKYAVDANHVYFGKYSIPGADPKTFEVIKSYLSGPIAERKVEINDEPTVENGGASENEQLYELALTNDVNGYYLYAKDKVHVYYLSPELDDYGSNENIPSPISAADPETFVLLSDDYSKDSQHVYFDGQVIGDADPSSFVLAAGSLNQFDARDKNHIYLDGQVVQ